MSAHCKISVGLDARGSFLLHSVTYFVHKHNFIICGSKIQLALEKILTLPYNPLVLGTESANYVGTHIQHEITACSTREKLSNHGVHVSEETRWDPSWPNDNSRAATLGLPVSQQNQQHYQQLDQQHLEHPGP